LALNTRFLFHKPIPIELLGVHIPVIDVINPKRSSSTMLFNSERTPRLSYRSSISKPLTPLQSPIQKKAQQLPSLASPPSTPRNSVQYLESVFNPSSNTTQRPNTAITFYHQCRRADESITLHALTELNRNNWKNKIEKVKDIKAKKQPIFEVVHSVQKCEFFSNMSIYHMITFSKFF
jgi:hypothetical protein